MQGRWLFIIDGIITLPLAVAGYLFFPNVPQGGKKTWWVTKREHELAVERMEAIGRAGKEPWTKQKARRILLSWHTYLLRKSPLELPCNDGRTDSLSNDLRGMEQRRLPAGHGVLA